MRASRVFSVAGGAQLSCTSKPRAGDPARLTGSRVSYAPPDAEPIEENG